MTMTTSTAISHTRSLYRRLLRELPPLPGPRHRHPRSPIHQSIRSQFLARASTGAGKGPSSSSSATSEEAEAESESAALLARRQEVEQYVAYLRAQRMYQTLLARYNPGMGMDEEERVRLSARRVGMEMPVEWKK